MTDVFRKEYKQLTDEQKDNILNIKLYAEDLLRKIEESSFIGEVDTKCLEISKAQLESAVMWAIKAIT